MYKPLRRSPTGIANFCRHQEDATPNSMHTSLHSAEEEYEPIYYPMNPRNQSSSEEFTPIWPLSNGGDYASSDGYRSLMAFNKQQRTAGKTIKHDRISNGTPPTNGNRSHGISTTVSV